MSILLLPVMSSGYPRKIDATIEQVRSIYSQLLEAIEAKVSREPTASGEAAINNVGGSSSSSGSGNGDSERTTSTNSMERVIQTVLQEYINEVVEMASNSLNVVNAATGADGTGTSAANSNNSGNVGILRQLLQQTQVEYVEPFDLELNERVRQKYQEWEELTVKVVQLRRNGPREVNEQYSQRQREFFDALDKRLEKLAAEEEAIAADSGSDTAADQGNGDDTKVGDIRSYVDSLRDLYEAKEGIASVRQNTDKLRGLFATLETD